MPVYKLMYDIHHCILKQTMKGMLHLVLLGVLILTLLVLVQAQDQSGFISIDCGLPENSSYIEKTTGINYISDAKFIDAGVGKQLGYVRSFPNGVRNCYKINVISGTKYLIRATFYYGNYDDLNKPQKFDLHLGTNLWDTIEFSNTSGIKSSEIIYIPSIDYIQPCLVNTGTGTPFISSIELRDLSSEVYVTDPNSVIKLLSRLDLGSITNLTYRYKDDAYDRIWFPHQLNNSTRLSTSLNPEDLAQETYYKPPATVMSTAATPINDSAPLEFSWSSINVNDEYYTYLHFNEVENLTPDETRAFNITMNDQFRYGPEIPTYQETNTIFSTTPIIGATRYQYSLFKTEDSTHPPILNALEIYKVIDFSQLETEQDYVDAMTNIKNVYGVARNWQGDPCVPVAFMWEGLNCRIDGNNINRPNIISLNLSSSGLTGQIASSISNLTMLKYLDLSNNSLSGPIPIFLTEMQSLKVLNLGKNNLAGLVPSGLLERSKGGSLSLSLEQNPNLCKSSASCNLHTSGQKNKKKNNTVITLVASIVGGILVLLVSI